MELQPCPRGFIRPSYLLHGFGGGGGGGGGGRGNACCPRRKNGLTSRRRRRRQGKFITLSLDTTFAAMQEGEKGKAGKSQPVKIGEEGFFLQEVPAEREVYRNKKRRPPLPSHVLPSPPLLKAPSALIPPSPTFFSSCLLAQAEALSRSNNFSHRHFSPFLPPLLPLFSGGSNITLSVRPPPPAARDSLLDSSGSFYTSTYRTTSLINVPNSVS